MPGEKWGQGGDLLSLAFSSFLLPQTTGSHHTLHTYMRTSYVYTPPCTHPHVHIPRHTRPGTQTPLRGSQVGEALCLGTSRRRAEPGTRRPARLRSGRGERAWQSSRGLSRWGMSGQQSSSPVGWEPSARPRRLLWGSQPQDSLRLTPGPPRPALDTSASEMSVLPAPSFCPPLPPPSSLSPTPPVTGPNSALSPRCALPLPEDGRLIWSDAPTQNSAATRYPQQKAHILQPSVLE